MKNLGLSDLIIFLIFIIMYDDTLIRKRGRRPKEAYVSIPISPTAANERIRR
jgi:hypothetical protein